MWNLLTEKESEKVRREQAEVIEHRACQAVEDRSCRVQNEHRSSVSYQQTGFEIHLAQEHMERGTELTDGTIPRSGPHPLVL